MNDLSTVIRRIAAESMPGSDKERAAVLLTAFIFNVHADWLYEVIGEERRAAS